MKKKIYTAYKTNKKFHQKAPDELVKYGEL